MTPDDALDALKCVPMGLVLESKGITKDYLAKKLKSELNAKETKFYKLKRSGNADRMLKEILEGAGIETGKKLKYKIIAETLEEQLVAVDVKSLGIRQKAREDAQKLLRLYPVEKKELVHKLGENEMALAVRVFQGMK